MWPELIISRKRICVLLITNKSVEHALRIVGFDSIMEAPDDVVASRRLPPGEHHAHSAQEVRM